MTQPPGPPEIVLVLVPLPGDVPVPVRVRQLLKYALRAQGLKCVDLRYATAEDLAELAKVLRGGGDQ